jgi:hypothetical protein
MREDLANLLGSDLMVCRLQRFPHDLLADREVPPLLRGEVFRYQGTAGASEVCQRASQIHADVDLAVRVGDLVDRLRSVHESAGYPARGPIWDDIGGAPDSSGRRSVTEAAELLVEASRSGLETMEM